MLRLGLCCKFYKEPILFKTTTAKYISTLSYSERLKKLSSLCLHNALALLKAIRYCSLNQIGCFRINSHILPLKTHPEFGYSLSQLPDAVEIEKLFSHCRREAKEKNIRLTFHPDQFIFLTSPDKRILKSSILELDYHAEVAELVGADVITIHAGGSYNDKKSALKRMGKIILKLDKRITSRLALENDDRVYSPQELLPFCKEYKVPFVYDVHHHRCLPDGLSIEQVTEFALKTWNREPLFHLSSSKSSRYKKRCFHSDYINIKDFPLLWKDLNITIEVEAKAKELAVKRLYKQLSKIIKYEK